MKYTYLGRTGMKVSRLCLGSYNFGTYTDEKESMRIMDAAADAGINFFDTANVYGNFTEDIPKGLSEEIIGRWFAQGGGRREKVVLVTKVFGKMNDANDGPNNCNGLSAYKIRRHIEGSLKRLGTDHIEIYQMHHVVEDVQWDEIWEVYECLVREGKVVYAGSSNFAGWQLVKAQAAAQKRNFFGLVVEEHLYNLICRLPELEVLPAAMDLGIGIQVWSPISGGVLGGNAASRGKNSRMITIGHHMEKARRFKSQLEEYSKLCAELDEQEACVSLAWLLANPAITAPITGPRTATQLEEVLRAVDIELESESLKRIDAIFPGPGGKAPEAYSW